MGLRQNSTLWTSYSKPCRHFLFLSRGTRSKEQLNKADEFPEIIQINQGLEQEVVPGRQAFRPVGSPITTNEPLSCPLNSCMRLNCGLPLSSQPWPLRVSSSSIHRLSPSESPLRVINLPPRAPRSSWHHLPQVVLPKYSAHIQIHYWTYLAFDLCVPMYCYLISGQCTLIKWNNVVIF